MADGASRDARDAIRALLARLGGEAMEGIELAELEAALSHPLAARTVAELLPREARSVQPGDPAPDFRLPWLPGQGREPGARATLSEHFGVRPVALVFGSYT